MQKMGLLVVALSYVVVSHSLAQVREEQHRLKYSVLYTDSEDVTHFRDEYFPWNDGGGDYSTTPLADATQIGFLSIHTGSRSDWHPAPRKQFVMVLDGLVEVEAGDGERREFAPGSVLLVTDTEGRGHRTNNLGDGPATIVWVPVP